MSGRIVNGRMTAADAATAIHNLRSMAERSKAHAPEACAMHERVANHLEAWMRAEDSPADDGGPAFPRDGFENTSGRVQGAQRGMSLRDYFAAAASEDDIQNALCDLSSSGGLVNCTTGTERRAAARVYCADAMLKARTTS